MKQTNLAFVIAFVFVFVCAGCSAIINPAHAVIQVKQGNTIIPSTTGYFDFGNVPITTASPEITFTIENIGTFDLQLKSINNKVFLLGSDTKDFIVNTSPTATKIAPNESTKFTIMFRPQAQGTKNATVMIPSNDIDNPDFKFLITGTCTPPAAEIHVLQDTTDILCSTGEYDFGEVAINNTSKDVVFTIRNFGNEVLKLNGSPYRISIQNNDASMFSTKQDTIATSIHPGSYTQFAVSFTPTSIGPKFATVIILNNDSDENPYTFTIKGTGSAMPEINVKQGSTDIPNQTGVFDFGSVKMGNYYSEVTFTIENLGSAVLHLTGNPDAVFIDDPYLAMFTLYKDNMSANIHPGNSTTFKIRFIPTSVGSKTASVTIKNDDSDENPYVFTVKGEVIKPDINVKYNTTNIPNSSGSFDKFIAKPNTTSREFVFTIENLGAAELKLTGSPIVEISGTDASQFDVKTTTTSASIAPGDDTNFGIYFKPTSLGVKTAQISIANDDINRNPYTFEIKGTCVTYTKGDVNADGYPDVVVGASYDDDGGNSSGCAFVFFGKQNWNSTIDASQADVKLVGKGSETFFGASVSLAGDVNNDGIEDIIIGAALDDDDGFNSGCAYIFFGRPNWPSSIAAADADVQLSSRNSNDEFGYSVSSAGDINNDGFDDIIVSSPGNDSGGYGSGSSSLFFGRLSWSTIIYASDADVNLVGEDSGDRFGHSVSDAGDVNDDGFDDVVVGAMQDNDGGSGSGCAFIFFGRSSWSTTVDASNANVKLIGEDAVNYFGSSVSNAGDVNNDGIEDVVIGAQLDDDGSAQSGCVFIFFGRKNWNAIIDASNTDVKIVGVNADDQLGRSVSNAGDVNNDGIDDFIISAHLEDEGNSNAGSVYIFFGRTSWSSLISASTANVKLVGDGIHSWFGYTIANIGDVNKDGFDDIIVDIPNAHDGGSTSGCARIFFGRSNWQSKITASNCNVKLVGADRDDRFGTVK